MVTCGEEGMAWTVSKHVSEEKVRVWVNARLETRNVGKGVPVAKLRMALEKKSRRA